MDTDGLVVIHCNDVAVVRVDVGVTAKNVKKVSACKVSSVTYVNEFKEACW